MSVGKEAPIELSPRQIRRRAYYQTHSEKEKARASAWYNANPDRVIARATLWNEAHRALVRSRQNRGIVGAQMACESCGTTTVRRGPGQKYCPPCAVEVRQYRQLVFWRRAKKKSRGMRAPAALIYLSAAETC